MLIDVASPSPILLPVQPFLVVGEALLASGFTLLCLSLVAAGEALDVVQAFCSTCTMAAQVFEASSYDLAVCSNGVWMIVPLHSYVHANLLG